MSETRRQLFKTSILSAFGLVAATAVAKATDFQATAVVVRTTKDGKLFDILVQKSSGQLKGYDVTGAAPEGKALSQIRPSTIASPGAYAISTDYEEPTKPVLNIYRGGVAKFKDLTTNAWNEIGVSRDKISRPPEH